MIAKFKPFTMAEALEVSNTLDARFALAKIVTRYRQDEAAGKALKISVAERKSLAELYAKAYPYGLGGADWVVTFDGWTEIRSEFMQRLLTGDMGGCTCSDWTDLDYWKCKAAGLLCSFKKKPAPPPLVYWVDGEPRMKLSAADRRLINSIRYSSGDANEIDERTCRDSEQGG